MKGGLAISCGAFLTLLGLFILGNSADAWRLHRSPLQRVDTRDTPRRAALEILAQKRQQLQEEERKRREFLENLTPQTMVEMGEQLVKGRGLCLNCHKVQDEGMGMLGPNLADVGGRAGTRVPEMSALDYLAQSLYRPADFVVPEYGPMMPAANTAPTNLTDLEIKMVIAYLQSLGGEVTITPETPIRSGETTSGK